MKSIRVAVAGDIHLGKKQYNSPEREKDFQKAWIWVCSFVQEQRPDLFILTGDLFDKKMVDPVTLSVAIEGLSGIDCPVLAVEGNHDGRSYIYKGRSWLEYLEDQGWIDRVLRPENTWTGKIVGTHVSVFGMPWSGRGANDAFKELLWDREFVGRGADINIIVAHAAPEDFVPGSGSIKMDSLVGADVDLICLGHCHKPFDLNAKVVCGGSPEVCDVSEIDHPGGVFVVEIGPSGSKSIELERYSPRGFARVEIGAAFIEEFKFRSPFSIEGSVVIADVVGPRKKIDLSDLRDFLLTGNPLLVRINDKMLASRSDIVSSAHAQEDLLDHAITSLLGDEVSVSTFNQVFDKYMAADIVGVVAVLLGDNHDKES